MRTVKEVSQLTGVSIRTLRYYDEIGLLSPTQLTDAGYRLYDDRALERLQEILFFKELELPLETIRQLLEDPSQDRQSILQMQQTLLVRKRNHLNGLIELIDDIMQGVNTMNFEAFTDDDIRQITDHTLSGLNEADRQTLIEHFGSEEAMRAELERNLQDPQLSEHLNKLYGGKDKAVQASLSADHSPQDMTAYQQENDAIYHQFATAMETNDAELAMDAVKRLAAINKAMFQFENARFFLLQLADEISGNELLMEATDKQYGDGVSQYMAQSIREYYGIS